MNARPLHNRTALLAALGALAAWGAARGGAAPQDPGPAPLPVEERALPPAPEVPQVDAEELWTHPGRYLRQQVRVRYRHKEWQADWEPFLTRFSPAGYAAVVGWGELQFPWERAAYEAPRVRAFARRGGAAEWALESARPYAGYELSCTVRAVFAGQPWLEIQGVRPLVEEIGEGTVLHAGRALELMERKVWERAADELERALAAPMPEEARAELVRLRERCRAEAARPREREVTRPPR